MKTSPNSEILALDFDHTLFLSNSTEEYIDSAKPKFLCGLLLSIIDFLKIWELFPGHKKRHVYRDAIRVLAVTIFFPWTYFFYITRTKHLIQEYLNPEIIELISTQKWEKIIIVSNGFKFIIMPLIQLMDVKFHEIHSSQIYQSSASIRVTGKSNRLKEFMRPDELDRTTFISDNDEDQLLRGVVGKLIHKKWKNEKRFKACQDVYIPFIYTHKSKRGNKNHVLNVIILENFSIILLAYGFIFPIDIRVIASLFFLVCSFWCIYEVGYYENDLYELKHETFHKNPYKLRYVEKLKDFPLEYFAWIWALGFATVGILILQNQVCFELQCLLPLFKNILIWAGWLLVVRIIYRVYNYSNFNIRQLFFPLLQITRLAGPAIFFPTNFLGLFLLTSQIVSRWVGYLIYRGGGNPQLVQKRLVRHFVFLILTSGLAIIQHDSSVFLSWQFFTILAWSVLRAHIGSFSNLRALLKISN